MSNVDPQSAAEFVALEKLRLAVQQYREEVGQLLQKRGLASTTSPLLFEEDDLPQEFALLAQAAKASFGSALRPEVPKPVVPVVVAPPPVVAPPVVAPPVVAPPVVVPPPVVPIFSPAARPQIAASIPQNESDEFTGATQDIRVKTSPFAPLTPSQPIQQVRAEAGLSMRGAPEPIAELKTPLPLSMEAQSAPRVNLPAASPSAMARRPGMSPSMQVETLGSFLRRFRLASE